jgi:hypothetical protein
MSRFINEIKTGETVQVGKYQITPQTRVTMIRSEGGHFGWIWNRPNAVIVRTQDGEESILPIVDVTRVIIWAMLAGGILGAMLVGLVSRNR